MKNTFILLSLIISVFPGQRLIAQEQINIASDRDSENNFFVNVTGELANPVHSFNDHANTLGGLRIEAGTKFSPNSVFNAGLAFTALFAGSREDNFKGMNLKTQSSLMEFHPFLRVSPVNNSMLKPYLDISGGVLINVTQSTTQITDRPTFLEQVLFNQEEEVRTTSHKDHTSANASLGIGAGIIINDIWVIGARYHHSNPINYVDKKKVFVADSSIRYESTEVPVNMLVVSLGFTLK